MNDVGKEYGTALFMLACEEEAKNEYAAALEAVESTFAENPEFQEILNSPALSLKERLHTIDEVFSETLPHHVLSFIKLLCEKGRISSFHQATKEFHTLFNASKQIFLARITSSAPLSDSEKEQLICKLEAIQHGKIRGEYFVDPSLIGGMTVEINGKIFDGSLRHRLYEIKEVMNHD